MPMTYPSKISVGLVVFVNLLTGGALVGLWLEGAVWPAVLPLGFVMLFSNHIFFTTFYAIENQTLRVKSGFIYSASIDIQSIKKISRRRSILSAPAASLDRLEIQYNKWDTVLVSPKDRDGFVEHLRQINPDIQVEL